MKNFNLKKFLLENKLTANSKMLNEVQQEEQDDTDREMFELQQQFLPQFKEFVRLYGIVLGVDIESEDPTDADTIPHRRKFFEELENVLFKLEHGEF